MKYIFKKESIEIPNGFRSLTDEEIATYKSLNKRVYNNLMKADIDREIPHIEEIDVTKFVF